MNRIITLSALILLLATLNRTFAMIDVGFLSKEEAAKLGITMQYRTNGDAGILVWLEFKKEGFLEKFTYAEFQMKDAKGKHLVTAMLEPHPVNYGQPKEITSVSFSADPTQLDKCAFMVVAYGSNRGDVGYVLRVRDFLTQFRSDLPEPRNAGEGTQETKP